MLLHDAIKKHLIHRLTDEVVDDVFVLRLHLQRLCQHLLCVVLQAQETALDNVDHRKLDHRQRSGDEIKKDVEIDPRDADRVCKQKNR